MNDIIKRNLPALFALLTTLQGCKSLPILQNVATSQSVTTPQSESVEGNYVNEYGDKLQLNPDGTGTAIDKHGLEQANFNVKYRMIDKEDGKKLVTDYYLSELDWNSYQKSYMYQAELRTGKSPDQIKAEAMEKKARTSIFHKEGDNKFCGAAEGCFVKQE